MKTILSIKERPYRVLLVTVIAFIGVGYLVANTVNIAINPNIPRPILYGIISGTYHLVGMFDSQYDCSFDEIEKK